MPDCVQPFTAGLVEEPFALVSAGRDSRQYAESEVPPLAHRPNAEPTSKHNFFTHFPKGSNCEHGKMINTMRARCQKRLEMRTDGDAFPTKFLEVTTADHHVSIEDNE